jgi:hypothetical protein
MAMNWTKADRPAFNERSAPYSAASIAALLRARPVANLAPT